MAIAPRAVTINRKADPRGACDEKKYEPCRTFPISSPTQRQCNGKSQDSRAASVPNDFTRSQAVAGRSMPRPALASFSSFSKSMRECPGRLVRGHGFGLGTAGAGTVAGAGALIGGFGLDILATPLGMLFIPWLMEPGW